MISTIREVSTSPVKMSFVTHRVPRSAMVRFGEAEGAPQAGDLVAGQVLVMGRHTAIESRASRRVGLFIGDVIIGAYGNRYATDQFEGYVGPASPDFHLLSVGGVCGQVASKNDLMPEPPTQLRLVGYVLDEHGQKINLRRHAMAAPPLEGERPMTIVVVGASMNSGKTTTVANAVRGLTHSGYRVAAAKITGTACSKDTWLMKDAGALAIHDFSDCGHPSTYLLPLDELKAIHRTLLAQLSTFKPEVVLFEIADGLMQRETEALLTDREFASQVDHVLFAGADSLSVESGVRMLESWGYHVAASSGLISCSVLGIKECQTATPNVPCFSAAALATGALLPRLGLKPRRDLAAAAALSGAGRPPAEGAVESARMKLIA
jgi:hypothetical protein